MGCFLVSYDDVFTEVSRFFTVPKKILFLVANFDHRSKFDGKKEDFKKTPQVKLAPDFHWRLPKLHWPSISSLNEVLSKFALLPHSVDH